MKKMLKVSLPEEHSQTLAEEDYAPLKKACEAIIASEKLRKEADKQLKQFAVIAEAKGMPVARIRFKLEERFWKLPL